MCSKLFSFCVLITVLVACSGDKSPLILTPMINNNKIEAARSASKVSFSEFKDVESYSGFLTVNALYNSNLFFWFFPSEYDYVNDPLILWLQGGPGTSSLFGLFLENGPFLVSSELELKFREISWTKNHSVLYIDNPVGTGFSFTDEDGYATNQTVIAKSLYKCLTQFFKIFPELRQNDFFIVGESFGGKYAPSLAHEIKDKNPVAKHIINLRGIGMANGFSDPPTMLKYSDFLHQHGLIDLYQKAIVVAQENIMAKFIREEKWTDASSAFFNFFNPTLDTSFQALTGFRNIYNILEVNNDYVRTGSFVEEYLKREDVRTAIHVGNLNFAIESDLPYISLIEDLTKTVAPVVAELTNHYQVLVYTGQLDLLVSYPRVVAYLVKLDSPSGRSYFTAERHHWYVNKKLAGYVKVAGNLTDVLVRNGGHMTTGDQPTRITDMIKKFTRFQQIY